MTAQIWIAYYNDSNGDMMHDVFIAKNENDARETFELRYEEEMEDPFPHETYEVFNLFYGRLGDRNGRQFSFEQTTE